MLIYCTSFLRCLLAFFLTFLAEIISKWSFLESHNAMPNFLTLFAVFFHGLFDVWLRNFSAALCPFFYLLYFSSFCHGNVMFFHPIPPWSHRKRCPFHHGRRVFPFLSSCSKIMESTRDIFGCPCCVFLEWLKRLVEKETYITLFRTKSCWCPYLSTWATLKAVQRIGTIFKASLNQKSMGILNICTASSSLEACMME